jgi:hypothetical protein
VLWAIETIVLMGVDGAQHGEQDNWTVFQNTVRANLPLEELGNARKACKALKAELGSPHPDWLPKDDAYKALKRSSSADKTDLRDKITSFQPTYARIVNQVQALDAETGFVPRGITGGRSRRRRIMCTGQGCNVQSRLRAMCHRYVYVCVCVCVLTCVY